MDDDKKVNSNSNDAVNKQIVDAVVATNLAVIGQSGNEAQGIAFESMAHSLTLAMQNAQATQFGAKQISTTAVAKTCAAILKLADS